jgi:hypothetical protein
LRDKLGGVECVQSQIPGRYFNPAQRDRLQTKLAEFPGVVVNVWRFTGTAGNPERLNTLKEKISIATALVDVFKAAHWRNDGVTVRLFPFPDAFRFITVMQRAGSDTSIDMAVKVLSEELNADCITAYVSTPFTNNGDYGQTNFIDKSGQHLDTIQPDIVSVRPLPNADISIMVGDAL